MNTESRSFGQADCPSTDFQSLHQITLELLELGDLRRDDDCRRRADEVSLGGFHKPGRTGTADVTSDPRRLTRLHDGPAMADTAEFEQLDAYCTRRFVARHPKDVFR